MGTIVDIDEVIANLRILERMEPSPAKLRGLAANDRFEDAVLWDTEANVAADAWEAEVNALKQTIRQLGKSTRLDTPKMPNPHELGY